MRVRFLLPLLLLTALLPTSAAEPEAVTVAVLVFRADGPGRRVPLPGARVACYTEDIRPVSVASRLVAEARADGFGVATMAVPADQDFHWIVEAEGHGVHHEYGTAEVFRGGGGVVLEPGSDRRFRVLGPFGRPLAGARVEMYLGCPHSPAVRVATTNEEGLAVLPNVSDYGWDLWITAPGVDPGPYPLPASAATGQPPAVITEWGATASGVVVGAEGGAVVRELDGFRGPVTTTDGEGRFTLHGLSGTAPIGVFLEGSRFAPRPDAVVKAFAEGVPLRIRLAKDHPTALGEGEPRHRLDVVIEKGDSFVPLRVTRLGDGFTVRGHSDFFTSVFDVPAGEYRVAAGGGFSFEAEKSVPVTVPVPESEAVHIPLTVQQAAFFVTVKGAPRGERGWLRIPGAEKEIGLSDVVWLPADAPAALFLERPCERIVPVPPARKGNRILDVPAVLPSCVRFRLVDPDGRELVPLGEVRRAEDGHYVRETFEQGEVEFTFEAEGYLDRDLVVMLPPPPSAMDLGTIVLRPEADLREREFRVLTPDGERLHDVEFVTEEDSLGEGEMELAENEKAAAMVEGFLPLPVVLTPEGPEEFRFPAGRLELKAKEGATAWLDGWAFDAEDGRIVIRGIPSGEHVLTVVTPGHPPESRRIQIGE